MDSDDPKLNERNWNHRMAQWEDICMQEFQLNYYGNISYESVEEMSSYERKYFYGLLVNQKETEAEERKKAIEASKSKK